MRREQNKLFGILLALGLILRLSLTPWGGHHDLLSNAGWGKWIYEHGTKGFYENNQWVYSWPTQPPVVSWIYKFNYDVYRQLALRIKQAGYFFDSEVILNFGEWFDTGLYKETDFPNGFLVAMKLPAIMADLAIAVLLYMAGGILVAGFYLFMPFSWYTSALWGQYDQLMVLATLLAFWLVFKRKFFWGAALFWLALEIKPVALMVAPLFGIYFLMKKPKMEIASSLATVVALTLATAKPFATGDLLTWLQEVLLTKIFFVGRLAGIGSRAFNLWQLLRPLGGLASDKYLGLSATTWGYLVLVGVNVGGVVLAKKSWQKAVFWVAGATYLFGLGMLDRYYFLAVVALAVLVVKFPKLLKYWVAMAILFTLNLYYSWGFPFLEAGQAWNNLNWIRIGALAQIVIFVLAVRNLKKE